MNGLKLQRRWLEGRVKGNAVVTRSTGRVKPRVTRRCQTARIVVFPQAVTLLIVPVAIYTFINIHFNDDYSQVERESQCSLKYSYV